MRIGTILAARLTASIAHLVDRWFSTTLDLGLDDVDERVDDAVLLGSFIGYLRVLEYGEQLARTSMLGQTQPPDVLADRTEVPAVGG